MAIDTFTTNTAVTLLKDKFCHISYDKVNGIVITKWIGFLKMEDLKKGIGVMLDCVKNNKVKYNLSDQTEMKVLSNDVQQYLVGEVFPELDRLGLRRLAVCVGEDIFAQMAVNNVNAKLTMGNVAINTFNSKDKCYNWLLEG